jgi:hypothetical protein
MATRSCIRTTRIVFNSKQSSAMLPVTDHIMTLKRELKRRKLKKRYVFLNCAKAKSRKLKHVCTSILKQNVIEYNGASLLFHKMVLLNIALNLT